MDTLEGRTRLATEAKPLLARVPDGLYRELLVDELTRMTGLEKATLKAALKDEKLPDPEPPPAPPPGSAPVQRQAQPIRRAARRASAPQSLSLADRAVRLLLQNPSSAQGIEPATLAPLLGEEEGFLLELLMLIHENPGLTTAGLMCSWLGTPQGERLGELAASEFLTPHEGVGQELGDLVKRLELQALSRELAAIIADLSTNPDPALLTRLQALKAREYQLKTTLSTGRTG
jgi:DNA primase